MRFAIICALSLLCDGALAASRPILLNSQTLHLRSGSKPEWQEFDGKTPDGAGISFRFRSQSNTNEATLLIQQDNVKLDWIVAINGKKLGSLFLMEAPLVYALSVAPGTLHDGENTLTIAPPKENDDILIGRIEWVPLPLTKVLNQSRLVVRIKDSDDGKPLPGRITIVDSSGNLAALVSPANAKVAVRPGVIYTSDGEAAVGLLPGTYTVYATRGFEYGLAQETVALRPSSAATIDLRIRREVQTPGWVCSDTHVHTFTYARHGDATIDERAITLAGEGIELPISTEHDRLVDLSGAALRVGARAWFTPVIGDEVTTAKGHFNIFPVELLAPVPNNNITDWPELIRQFRSTPGVQVVVLNHPRNIHNQFQPFAETNFNAVTGFNRRGFEFNFDAIEVANSSALQSDWMASYRDWFALLNYGCRVTAVGSSDGHDVSRYIVGQGRTYIACDDSNPAAIQVAQACRNLRHGRALVSLGLLTDMRVDGKYRVGDLATNLESKVQVSVTVSAPSWVKADRIELFANGSKIREEKLALPGAAPGATNAAAGPFQIEVSWELPKPKHDVHLVALATGPGIREPYWALARPYQPSSPVWDPRVAGLTNPIWLDADGDGKFTPARSYAKQLLDTASSDLEQLEAQLASYDQSVRDQVKELSQLSAKASSP